MRETMYGGTLARKIEREIGGQVIKIADKATLGLPDNLWIFKGRVCMYETKIGKIKDPRVIDPWIEINKRKINQYETCKEISKNALVFYTIYYPEQKASCVMLIKDLDFIRDHEMTISFFGPFIERGHGIQLIKKYWEEYNAAH